MMSPSRFSHDDADGQRDLQALVAIGDHYEQEAAPPDTDGSLRDLHQKAAQNLSSVMVKPEPERVPSHDHAVSALDPGQESAPDDGTSEQESRKPSVLVVDDDEAICQLIAVNLQFEGFNVVGVAADGRKAVGLVGRELPALVTMDIMMPVMDGIEATKIITREHPSTRVIMVTARTDRETLYRCLTAGAVGFLTKPFSIDELTATMREAARGGLPIAAAIMASMPEKEAGNVPGPPVAFFTEVESVILRHLAENASPRTIAAATELTLPEVAEIQSLIAQKIELRNAIERHSSPHSQ